MDPTNGKEFLKQIKKHCSRFGDNEEMNLEKLSHLCTSQVDGEKNSSG